MTNAKFDKGKLAITLSNPNSVSEKELGIIRKARGERTNIVADFKGKDRKK